MVDVEENAYEILGLNQGPAATDTEIRKVRGVFMMLVLLICIYLSLSPT